MIIYTGWNAALYENSRLCIIIILLWVLFLIKTVCVALHCLLVVQCFSILYKNEEKFSFQLIPATPRQKCTEQKSSSRWKSSRKSFFTMTLITFLHLIILITFLLILIILVRMVEVSATTLAQDRNLVSPLPPHTPGSSTYPVGITHTYTHHTHTHPHTHTPTHTPHTSGSHLDACSRDGFV